MKRKIVLTVLIGALVFVAHLFVNAFVYNAVTTPIAQIAPDQLNGSVVAYNAVHAQPAITEGFNYISVCINLTALLILIFVWQIPTIVKKEWTKMQENM